MESYLDRIKLLKNERKMTNDQLSELTGIPLGTLSKILAGMSDSPKLSNIVAICSALDCSVEYIVSGTPENTNNYTLSGEEISMIERFRTLDRYGRELVETVISMERARVGASLDLPEQKNVAEPVLREERESARILRPLTSRGRYAGEQVRTEKRSIFLYDLPVSAGVGVYLDEASAESISVPNTEKTAEADYALRIRGNSMEPKYHDGDVLLVKTTDAVDVGELGIFLLDGCGFFKVFGGDRLLSLNPEYGPILLKDFSDVQCKGQVVGRLKRK
ncbi:MAG: helix-turn-helix domain-containing protein [Ruminococcaceae bacterium]|nr:helix-turn-helix domain-containing protein [Oscillospiraceae bacterium]